MGLAGYLEAFIEDRRRAPQDDLVTRLIQAEDGGDRLSPARAAQHDRRRCSSPATTPPATSSASRCRCSPQHPEQWRLLADRPELTAAAVEEVLRFQGTVAVAPRIAREELNVGDYHVPAGRS